MSLDYSPDGKWIAVAGYTKNPDLEGRVTVFHYETIDNSYKYHSQYTAQSFFSLDIKKHAHITIIENIL